MNTPATDNTIAFLMASNNEDIAQDLANEITALKLELERVKRIAANRLEELTRLKTRPIRDRERAQLDAMIAKNNEYLDAVGARMTFVGGRWVIAERAL